MRRASYLGTYFVLTWLTLGWLSSEWLWCGFGTLVLFAYAFLFSILAGFGIEGDRR